MIRGNKLTQLEGPRKWRFWRNFAKVEEQMVRAIKLNELKGP